MILKVKKTSEVVDAAIYMNSENKVYATYWTKGTNQGKGGWVTTKISALCPVNVETDREQYSKMCQAKIDEVHRMYRDMFDALEAENKKDYDMFYNKGNDCDSCMNQYLTGKYGDAWGCKRADRNLECEYVEVSGE